MAVFDWFGRKENAPGGPDTEALPGAARHAQAAGLQQQRRSHRELLFGLVRQAMLSRPLPATSYKFKVLALDAAGQSFVVMVDLIGQPDGAAPALKDIETLVMDTAATNFDIDVRGMYWRFEAPVATASATAQTMGVAEANNAFVRSGLARQAPDGSVLDQIAQQEMLAFRKVQEQARAQAPGVEHPQPNEQAPKRTRQDLLDNDGPSRPSPLSPTQFGDL